MLGDHPINQGKPAETKLRRVGPSLVNTGYRPGMEREARMVLGQRAGKVFVWGGLPSGAPVTSIQFLPRGSKEELPGGWLAPPKRRNQARSPLPGRIDSRWKGPDYRPAGNGKGIRAAAWRATAVPHGRRSMSGDRDRIKGNQVEDPAFEKEGG